MLLEADIIRAVSAKLRSDGYQIVQQLQTSQHRDEIVAVKRGSVGRELRIHVKGDSGVKPVSDRYAMPVDSADASSHVAQALYLAVEGLCKPNQGIEIRSGIALPDNQGHRAAVRKIEPALNQLGIAVFWVREDGTVQVSSTWPL